MEQRNARIGRVLFVIYALLYGSFVLINAFSPATMEATPFAGINVAVIFGFGLIIVAFLLALLYGWLCRSSQPDAQSGEDRS